MTATEQNIEGTEDQGVILVSEFPPPPYYFRYAEASPGAIPTDGSKKKKSSSMSSGEDEKVSPEIWGGLTPPIIPTDAFLRLSRKVALTAAAAKEDVEKNRINASLDTPLDFSTNSEVEGITLDDRSDALDGITPDQRDKAPNVDSSEDKDLVAVFGEYVEDPLLVQLDDDCEEPSKVRNEVSRLNKEVLQGFAKLLNELVNRPRENKKCRDELSHNVFLMLQECNKFREHQARESLIDTLSQQLQETEASLKNVKKQILKADNAIGKLEKISSPLDPNIQQELL